MDSSRSGVARTAGPAIDTVPIGRPLSGWRINMAIAAMPGMKLSVQMA